MECTISKINKIGIKIKDGIILNSDEQEIFNYFRQIHELIFEEFYKKIKLPDKYIVVTRLKRMESIIDKLRRPNSSKLSRIDDIAGIRIIVNNFTEIYEISELLEKLLISNNCQLKYNKDYIEFSKKDGYRSLHKIFTFSYENKNLNFEIQIRTKLQHLWSTTVEIYDLIEYKNLKSGSFNKLKTWEGLFFKRCSKVIENFEKNNLVYSKKMIDKIFKFKKYIKIFEKLKTIKSIKNIHLLEGYKDGDSLLLIIDIEKGSINFLDEEPENLVTYYNILEQESKKNIKLLLLTIKNIKKLQSAYSNYFLDNDEFIKLLETIYSYQEEK
ncbi:RelA/SpoT domain-containing protein [Fusobacterium periodonticum]|jgi:hypothetical protein|uniref:RelA/SpoT domain-containing protein n=1 Tax=Fusobacterium periodonticum TaxID=860 RepID=UPI00195B3D13|nr:RelA/SpoT domain-containing protein [Fusobacterium periodonticum]VTX85742.1 GTP pyrophosphokinase YwaC [Fusobacterium periodonticum]